MRTIRALRLRAPAVVLLTSAIYASTLAAKAAALPVGSLALNVSNQDLALSFQSASPQFYTVQASADLSAWSNLPPGFPGDNTLKTLAVSNAATGNQGFYRLLIQQPFLLVLPQSDAFAVLGHSCGGIKETVYLTGFDPTNGFPTGVANLSTSCSTGGRGAPVAHFNASAAVTWDFAGNVVSYSKLSNAVAANATLTASDAFADVIYNAGGLACLIVPIPAAPIAVAAVQSGDAFQVSWLPSGVNPAAISSTTLTATPINSTNPVLTTTVTGPATNASIPMLQPSTTYQITAISATIGGTSAASTPQTATTSPATIPPAAPELSAAWSIPEPTGTTDTMIASWSAPDPGNSPIDEYLITAVGSDGAGTVSQTVSGGTLTAYFDVNFVPNWKVTVQAHNAAGWGPVSPKFNLGGL